jgi:NADH dehydrogenase FAD-containing subunit
LFLGLSEGERKRLLHCVVVGGGPTGVEFSGELSDFIMRDVRERHTHVKDDVKVTLIEVRICSAPYETPNIIISVPPYVRILN